MATTACATFTILQPGFPHFFNFNFNFLSAFLVILLFAGPEFCSCDKTEASLTKIVTSKSREWRDYRPVIRNSELIYINFSLSISQLVNLDTRNQVVVSSVWPTHEWRNPLINWEPEEHDGITHLYLLSGITFVHTLDMDSLIFHFSQRGTQ